MLRLLKIEWQKLWPNRFNLFLIITYFLMIIFFASIPIIKLQFFSVKIDLVKFGALNFPYIWHLSTFLATLLKWFLVITMINLIVDEYSCRTLKQNLIDGLTKTEFLAAKVLIVTTLIIASTLFVFVVSLILGLVFSFRINLELIFTDLDYFIAYFVEYFFIFSFCLLLSFLIKRKMGVISMLFLIVILDFSIGAWLQWKNFAFGAYLPFTNTSSLIIEPFSRLNVIQDIAQRGGIEIGKDYAVNYNHIFISILYSLIFIWLSYRSLKHQDL